MCKCFLLIDKIKMKILYSLVLVIVAFGSYVLEYHSSDLQGANELSTVLELDSGSYDFGTVWEQDGFEWPITIRNRSEKEVQIKKFLTSCRCTEVEPTSINVPGDSEVKVTLKLNLRQYAMDVDALVKTKSSDFSVSVSPQFDNSINTLPIKWMVKGSVKKALSNIPREIELGSISEKSRQYVQHEFEVDKSKDVSSLSVSSTSSLVSAEVISQSDSRVRIYLQTDLSDTEVLNTELILNAKTQKGIELPAIKIPVSGHIVQDIESVPPRALLGIITKGRPKEKEVLLKSRSGHSFKIQYIKCDDPNIKVTRVNSSQLDSNESAAYRIKVSPVQTHKSPSKVMFTVFSRENSSEVSVIPLEVIYMQSEKISSEECDCN